MQADCEICGAMGARISIRLNPRNLAESRRRLCRSCREMQGYLLPEYGHYQPSSQHVKAYGRHKRTRQGWQ